MVVSFPCSGGSMLIVGTARACCAVNASRCAFGCDGDPDRIVPCAGDENVAALFGLGILTLQ